MKAIVRHTDRKNGTATYKLDGVGRNIADINKKGNGCYLGCMYGFKKYDTVEGYEFDSMQDAIDFFDDYFSDMHCAVYWN